MPNLCSFAGEILFKDSQRADGSQTEQQQQGKKLLESSLELVTSAANAKLHNCRILGLLIHSCTKGKHGKVNLKYGNTAAMQR